MFERYLKQTIGRRKFLGYTVGTAVKPLGIPSSREIAAVGTQALCKYVVDMATSDVTRRGLFELPASQAKPFDINSIPEADLSYDINIVKEYLNKRLYRIKTWSLDVRMELFKHSAAEIIAEIPENDRPLLRRMVYVYLQLYRGKNPLYSKLADQLEEQILDITVNTSNQETASAYTNFFVSTATHFGKELDALAA